MKFSKRTKKVTRACKLLIVEVYVFLNESKEVKKEIVYTFDGCTLKEFKDFVSSKFGMPYSDFNIVSFEVIGERDFEATTSLLNFAKASMAGEILKIAEETDNESD